MAVERLNNALVSKLPAKDKPYEVRDVDVKGLYVQVQPTGKKTYMLNYGRGKKFKIGDADSLTATQSRTLAKAKKAEAAAGKDPQEARKRKQAGTFTEYFRNHYQRHILEHQKGTRQALCRYKNLCEHSEIGRVRLPEITALRIAKYQSKRKEAGTKDSTINRDVAAITALVRHAYNMGFLSELPFKGKIKKYREVFEHPRYLSLEEETRLRAALEARDAKNREERKRYNAWRRERNYPLVPEIGLYSDHLTPLVLTAMLTGLRKGELFNLTWQDINFQSEMLTVKAKGAKSGKTRTVPLPNECLEVLTSWMQITKFRQPENCVFPNKKGEQLNNVDTSFRNLLKAAEIIEFRFHDLRHHYASRLVQLGVQLYTVKELLGHSEFKMTQRYAHLTPDNLKDAVKVLDRPPGSTDGKLTGIKTVSKII